MGDEVLPRVVVIGASSGGVEALNTVVAGLPHDLQAAVFIVLHTSPSSPALLARILGRAAMLPVRTAAHGEPITPGQVLVAPPDQHLVLTADHVVLNRGPLQNRVRPAIDALFLSAAVFHGAGVIGTVLSGSLSDGSAGLAAIKRCGGVAIVQDPRDAAFPDMPRHAIEADSPDLVLPLDEIAAAIVAATRQPRAWREIPSELAIEAAPGVRLGMTAVALNDRIGQRAALTCTQCGGPLWRLDGKPQRFRCHIGHTFDEVTLLESKAEEAVRALWIAVRTLEERAHLLEEMALASERARRIMSATKYAQRQEELAEAARAVRALIRWRHEGEAAS